MDLEPVIENEVDQKEKNKYHILMHVRGIQKNGTEEPICKAGTERQTQNGHVDLGVEGKGRVT